MDITQCLERCSYLNRKIKDGNEKSRAEAEVAGTDEPTGAEGSWSTTLGTIWVMAGTMVLAAVRSGVPGAILEPGANVAMEERDPLLVDSFTD